MTDPKRFAIPRGHDVTDPKRFAIPRGHDVTVQKKFAMKEDKKRAQHTYGRMLQIKKHIFIESTALNPCSCLFCSFHRDHIKPINKNQKTHLIGGFFV